MHDAQYSTGRIVDIRKEDQQSGIWLYLDVSVYADENHKSSIDIRDRTLEANGRSRITGPFIEALKAKNVGKKIHLVCSAKTGWKWAIVDWSELDLIIR